MIVVSIIAGIVLLGALGAALIFWRSTATVAPPHTFGGVADCKKVPPFAKAHGFSGFAAFSTQGLQTDSLLLYEPQKDGSISPSPPPFTDPSWKTAGYLINPIIDRDGAVWVAPAPWINILRNPPAQANALYRIDPTTAVMSKFVDLPTPATPDATNPYGPLASTYDCDTHSIYLSSILGSTRQQQRGRIFRIDLTTKAVSVVLDGVDPFGLTVFNTTSEKRLYFALARQPMIESIALDATGNPLGTPRPEIDLTGLGVRGDERARRMTINANDKTMSVRLIQFDYTLAASTNPRETTLTYRYITASDRWERVVAQ